MDSHREIMQRGVQFKDKIASMHQDIDKRDRAVNLQTYADAFAERKVLRDRIAHERRTKGRTGVIVTTTMGIILVVLAVVGIVTWYMVNIVLKRRKLPGNACTTSDDCGKGSLCMGAFCSSPKACSIHFVDGEPVSSCPDGSDCVGGMCQPTSCFADRDCANSGAPNQSVRCGPSRTCVLGCRTSKDCPLAERNKAIGADGALTASRTCKASSDCASGETCMVGNGGITQCVVPCSADSDCPKDAPCADVFGNGKKVCSVPYGGRGACIAGGCVQGLCKADSDCLRDGASCVPVNNETHGLKACKIKCASNSDCPSGVCAEYNNSGVKVCQPIVPSGTAGQSCTVSSDCKAYCSGIVGSTPYCTKSKKKCVCVEGSIPSV